jgi:hypothetical protein
VVGYTGNPRRPRTLVVKLPGGRRALSQRLDPRTALDAAAYLTRAESGGLAHTGTGGAHAVVFPVKFYCSGPQLGQGAASLRLDVATVNRHAAAEAAGRHRR